MARHLKDVSIDQVTGEAICKCCGMVIEEKLVDLSHPDSISDDVLHRDNSDHHGLNQKLTYVQMNTVIGKSNKDYHGRKISSDLHRLRHAEKVTSTNSPKSRRLIVYLGILNSMNKKLHIPVIVRDHAAYIIRKHPYEFKSRRRVEMVAACLFLGYRIAGLPKPYVFFEPVIDSMRRFKLYVRTVLEIHPVQTNVISSLHSFITQVSSQLKLHPKITRRAEQLLEEVRKGQFETRRPSIVAATLLYIAAVDMQWMGASLDYFSSAVGCKPSTISAVKHDMMSYLQDLKLKQRLIARSRS